MKYDQLHNLLMWARRSGTSTLLADTAKRTNAKIIVPWKKNLTDPAFKGMDKDKFIVIADSPNSFMATAKCPILFDNYTIIKISDHIKWLSEEINRAEGRAVKAERDERVAKVARDIATEAYKRAKRKQKAWMWAFIIASIFNSLLILGIWIFSTNLF